METANKTVLLVDDDPAVRRSIQRVLEAAGYLVAVATNGEEAIRQFLPQRIDLVLLDLDLPVLGGWDVFERLTTWCPLVPVIIITGLPNQYRFARNAGAGALMEKPVEAPALLQAMKELLAEPNEARLRRMCGYEYGTRYSSASSLKNPPKLYQRPGSRRSVPTGEG